MKEGWEYKKLGDVFASINNGANIRQTKGASGIPITRIETLSNDMFNRDRMGYANIGDISPYESYVLNDGDILMSHINSMKFLGRAVAYVKKGDETIIHGMNLLRLVPTSKVFSPFIVYQFQTSFFRNQILQISHQSVNQASFNITNLKGLNVLVPSLSEQQSIVDYLDSAFAKIDAMKANAEKALNEAKALFQASLKEMLEPKEGWEEKPLNKISNYSIGLTYKPSDVSDKGTIVLRSSNIQNDKLDLVDIVKVSCPIKEALYVQKGDILMCSRNGSAKLVGKVAIIPETTEKMTYGTFMMIIRGDYNPFLFYFFKSDNFRNQIKHGEANMINQITRYMLDDVVVNVPPLSEQQSIVTTLDSLKSKVDRLQENFDKIFQECNALKQAILRQVFE